MERFVHTITLSDDPRYRSQGACGRYVRIAGGALNGDEGRLPALHGFRALYLPAGLPECFSADVEPECSQML